MQFKEEKKTRKNSAKPDSYSMGKENTNHHSYMLNSHQVSNKIDNDIVAEQQQTILQMRETIEILELKIKKLESLVKIKDSKIMSLTNKVQSSGMA